MTQPKGPSNGRHATPEELADYAVQPDRVPPLVAEHITQCPECSATVHQYDLLGAALYRIECPPMDDLQAFALNLLASEQIATVAAHVDTCPSCREDLTAIQAVVVGPVYRPAVAAQTEPANTPAAWEQLRERARRIVAQLLPASPGLGLALKSDGDQEVSLYSIPGEELELSLRRSHGPPGTTLLGRVIGAEHPISARLIPAAVTAESDAVPPPAEDQPPPENLSPAAEAVIAEGGSFELGPVAAGRYSLELLLGDQLIVIADLDL